MTDTEDGGSEAGPVHTNDLKIFVGTLARYAPGVSHLQVTSYSRTLQLFHTRSQYCGCLSVFAGNLKYSATNVQLSEHFGRFGEVVGVKIVLDR